MEVPTIYKAYFSGLNFREYLQNIWPKIWYSTANLGSWRSPIDQSFADLQASLVKTCHGSVDGMVNGRGFPGFPTMDATVFGQRRPSNLLLCYIKDPHCMILPNRCFYLPLKRGFCGVLNIRAKGLFPCLVVHKRSHSLFTEEVTQAWIDPSKKVISHEIPFYQAVSNSIQ